MNKSSTSFVVWLVLFLILNLLTSVSGASKLIPAFPSAEGFGAFTPGGRGGKIYIVTTLEDYNSEVKEKPISGSFRQAIEAQGPRIVVFRVSGTIEGKCPFIIREPYITIAGQTSPGGVCVSDLEMLTHNIIVRFMRIRSAGGGDPAGGTAQDVIFDHCSISWGSDEVISFKDYSDNITIQWSIISDSPLPHSMGSIIHGLGGISVHHNLYAHLWYRTPRIDGMSGFIQDIRNNVIYNFGGEPIYPGAKGIFVNIVGNYFKEGPSTPSQPQVSGYEQGKPILLLNGLKAFISGNSYYGRSDLSSDNWNMVNPHLYGIIGKNDSTAYETMAVEDIIQAAHKYRDALIKSIKADLASPCGTVKTDTAQDSYEKIIKNAGAYLPLRDDLDKGIIDDVVNGTGAIKTKDQIGKYPQMLENAQVPEDKDRDGISDGWEILHGLDPNDASDAGKDNDGDGYTNIEEYLNYLAQETERGGINPNKPFDWVEPPAIIAQEQMSFGRGSGLKDWLQCYGDFRYELPVRFIGSTEVAIESTDKDADIRYTLDGSEPSSSSEKYSRPFKITKSGVLRAKAFSNNVESVEVFKKFIADFPLKARVVDETQMSKGLSFQRVKMTSGLDVQQVLEKSKVSLPHLFPIGNDSSVIYNGFIKIPRYGIYKFNFIYPGGKMDRQDGCAVKIDDQNVLCFYKNAENTLIDSIALESGFHKIEIIYRTRGYRRIELFWKGPSIEEQKTPDNIFWHLSR